MNRKYHLDYAGEIRFGPSYYSLEIQGTKIKKYHYGASRAELESGRYLAIEEWLTTDYQEGPITRVAIFDLDKGLVSKLKSVDKGFVSGFKLEDGVFRYRKEFCSKGKVVASELDWSSIKNWVPITVHKTSLSIEFAIMQQESTGSFAIWISGEQAFCESEFLKLLEPLELSKKERVFSSIGPAENIDEIYTKQGVFNLSREFDEFAGITIYSANRELMSAIYNIMINSGQYHARK